MPATIPSAPKPATVSSPQPQPGSDGVSDIKKVAENPAGAVADKAMSAVTGQFSAADNRHRFNQALSKAHKTERAPLLPQYRLSLVEGGVLIAVSATVDLIDWIAGLFSEVIIGEIIVIIVDIIYGILLACYCKFRLKLPIAAHLPIYISILGAEFINYIPLINAAWWADAWYIIHTIRSEDRQVHQQLMEALQAEDQDEQREEWMQNYQMQQQENSGSASKIERYKTSQDPQQIIKSKMTDVRSRYTGNNPQPS